MDIDGSYSGGWSDTLTEIQAGTVRFNHEASNVHTLMQGGELGGCSRLS